VTARSNRPDPPTPRPLSNWSIAAGALVVLATVAVLWFVLLRRDGGQRAQLTSGLLTVEEAVSVTALHATSCVPRFSHERSCS
jgi:hypothetical protein